MTTQTTTKKGPYSCVHIGRSTGMVYPSKCQTRHRSYTAALSCRKGNSTHPTYVQDSTGKVLNPPTYSLWHGPRRTYWLCGECGATAEADYQSVLVGASYHARVTGHEMPWVA